MLRYLASRIDEKLRDIEADMALGKAADFEAYKFACGIYRGLLVAKGLIQDTEEKVNNDDFDEDA